MSASPEPKKPRYLQTPSSARFITAASGTDRAAAAHGEQRQRPVHKRGGYEQRERPQLTEGIKHQTGEAEKDVFRPHGAYKRLDYQKLRQEKEEERRAVECHVRPLLLKIVAPLGGARLLHGEHVPVVHVVAAIGHLGLRVVVEPSIITQPCGWPRRLISPLTASAS